MKTRVLLIDDHVPSRSLIARALTEEDFEVAGEGTNGKDLPAMARVTNPDVILMAVGLAGMDGISAARKIMGENPLPIVLVTSHYQSETIQRAKEAAVMGYLIKPVRHAELRPSIEIAIARYKELLSLKGDNENLKKTLEARKVIERAKGILMKSEGLSEAEAFALIQKKSMDTRKSMAEIARALVLAEDVTRQAVSKRR